MCIRDSVRRVFLADGDALVLETDYLVKIIDYLFASFPDLERVTSYASPYNLDDKTLEDLTLLRKKGLTMIYYGIETGNMELLKWINKEFPNDKAISGLNKAKQAGM